MSNSSGRATIRNPLEVISELSDPLKAERLAENARIRGNKEVEHAARQRALLLRAKAIGASNEFETDLNFALLAYEEVLARRNGKRQLASRTRQMIAKYGPLEAVARIVRRGHDAVGFSALIDLGLTDYTFESLALKNSEKFDAETIETAKQNLRAAGLDDL